MKIRSLLTAIFFMSSLLWPLFLCAGDSSLYFVIDNLKQSTVMILVLNEKGQEIPLGSGFMATKDGLVVTANHVVSIDKAYLDNIRCKLPNGDKYKFAILKSNDKQDIAILKIDHNKKDFKFLQLGNYSEVREGDDVLFSGFPRSLPFLTIHKGMISSKYHTKFTSLNLEGDWLQIDGSINRGNSGGPVVNMKDGKVIGIINFIPAGIGEKLKKLRENILQQRKSGVQVTVKIAGIVDPVDSILDLINILDDTISVGIGHSISITHIKNDLDTLKTAVPNNRPKD